jgi:hypothetical protein
MSQSSASQAARYNNTRRRIARQQCASLPQYTAGMVLTTEDIIGAYAGTTAYAVTVGGTTTGSGPPNTEPPLTWTDGAVTFVKMDMMGLLRVYGVQI